MNATQNQNVTINQALGAFLGWSIPAGWTSTRGQVRAALAAVGLPETLMNAELCDSDTFIRSVQEIGDRIAKSNPGTKTETTRVKALTNDSQVVYVVGIHGVNAAQRWEAREALRFVYHRDRHGPSAFESEDPAYQDELWMAGSENKYRVGKKDLVDTIQRAITGLKFFPVESMNGSKFLPAVHIPDAERLAQFLDELDRDVTRMSLWTIADTPRDRVNTALDLRASIENRLQAAMADQAAIREDQGKGQRIQGRRIENARNDLIALREELAFYIDGVRLDKKHFEQLEEDLLSAILMS